MAWLAGAPVMVSAAPVAGVNSFNAVPGVFAATSLAAAGAGPDAGALPLPDRALRAEGVAVAEALIAAPVNASADAGGAGAPPVAAMYCACLPSSLRREELDPAEPLSAVSETAAAGAAGIEALPVAGVNCA